MNTRRNKDFRSFHDVPVSYVMGYMLDFIPDLKLHVPLLLGRCHSASVFLKGETGVDRGSIGLPYQKRQLVCLIYATDILNDRSFINLQAAGVGRRELMQRLPESDSNEKKALLDVSIAPVLVIKVRLTSEYKS